MSLSINTNSSASIAASNLSSTNTMLQKSLQRLSSGQRIVNSSDDAGGLAVSIKMSAAIARTGATSNNLANAQSFLKTQDGALATATQVLTRMSELTTLAQDVTKTTGDNANYQTEFAALQGQLTAIGSGTFNGVSLFAASTATAGVTSTVYTNEDSSTSTTITKTALLGESTMAAAVGATTATVSTVSNAVAATATIATALSTLAGMRAQNGSEASKLSFGQEMLTTNKNNLSAANSLITDVDVASESTQLARFNILQQAGTSMLAQANQSTQSVLKLLQ